MTPADVKSLWYRHAVAENARKLEELVATLSEDCVYDVIPWGLSYAGKDEARRFYRELWSALPDVKLTLLRHVIDEHCLVEESIVYGTHQGAWHGLPPSGNVVEFPLVIFFPVRDGLFTGERLYFDGASLLRQLNAPEAMVLRGRPSTPTSPI
ncbi:MAG: ester cyclase [Armatimonadota bacterium]